MAWLQRIKEGLSAVLPGEVVLVGLGLACYFLTCLIARKPLTWPWALAPRHPRVSKQVHIPSSYTCYILHVLDMMMDMLQCIA